MSFYVGQKVVCVIAQDPYLTRGREYVVTWAGSVCPCGDGVCVAGIKGTTGAIKCSVCGKITYSNNIVFDSRRFRPIDPLHEALDRIEENHTVEPEPAFA